MNQISASDIVLCQKSLKGIQDSLLLAIDSQNAEALVDVLLSTRQHFALCAEKGMYLAIDEARDTIYQTLKGNEKFTWSIISNSGISAEIIGLLANTIGRNLAQTILRASSSYNQDYSLNMADESALLRASMKEVMLMAKPDYSAIRLHHFSNGGNHQCIVDAIEFFSKFEDGALHLAHVDLWRTLRNYKPSRNTKQNYLKLPDNVKRAIKKHESLVTASYHHVRSHQNHAACSLWVVRELFEFDLKELALLLMKDVLRITPSEGAPDGIVYSFPKTNDRSYRVASLMHQMGYVKSASGFAANWISRETHGDSDALNRKMCAIVYHVENEGTSPEIFSDLMKLLFSDFEKDYPDKAIQYLMTVLFELRRNLYTANSDTQAKLSTLSSHIGHLYGEYKSGAQMAKASIEDRNGADIIEEITSSHGYKRGSLISDLGM